MTLRRNRKGFVFGLLAGLLVAGSITCSVSTAQPPPLPGGPPLPGADDPFNLLGPPGMSGAPGAKAEFTGEFQVAEGTREGRLLIHARIQPNWHLYSTTQASGGPMATEIAVTPSTDVRLMGQFQADRDPHVHVDPAFPDVMSEEFSVEVTWTMPIELAPNVDPAKITIGAVVNGQACETGGSCVLLENIGVECLFNGFYRPVEASGTFHDSSTHATFSGHAEPKEVKPGEQVKLVITATMPESWHIYERAEIDKNLGFKPTLIVLRKTLGWPVGPTEVSEAPKTEPAPDDGSEPLAYHEATVSWSIPVTVPAGTQPGKYELKGAIAYQTCTSEVCDQPTGAEFQVTLTVGPTTAKGLVPMAFSSDSYEAVAKDAATHLQATSTLVTIASSSSDDLSQRPLLFVLAVAFLAGLILNVMPCVLPVIGLKVMSFVQQAGGSRREILTLNLWFSLGLLSVFWVLAGMAAFANMGWAEHFSNTAFTVSMLSVVFAFGLSFLGTWEIPIPGFVGSGKMGKAAEREGAAGAYSKGVLSTILATPCAGPLLVPAVSWAIKQPTGVTFLAFTCIGLGMAAPYLLIGAFPRLINALPKPGAWMETFKQLMGFLLLGTVIFLFRSVPEKWITSTLVLLLGIGIGCWWIGRVPLTAGTRARLLGWCNSLLIIAAGAALGFLVLVPAEGWIPYTRLTLDQNLAEGHTVLVDFTANW